MDWDDQSILLHEMLCSIIPTPASQLFIQYHTYLDASKTDDNMIPMVWCHPSSVPLQKCMPYRGEHNVATFHISGVAYRHHVDLCLQLSFCIPQPFDCQLLILQSFILMFLRHFHHSWNRHQIDSLHLCSPSKLWMVEDSLS